ncbi:MarR family winged helix-turn-helix transcriptional regulator [Methanobacterium paludis]|uniref:Transcriptional regulator, MarR family n=1 Tax=Methanobacterium paludis (strain DSM 25820 / JCM 18151 / SWAN1) TaxID=868131 RepID=F6D567_METPW|nr:MarR family transcriptional regulator [Methanobacterium paludis]AEG18175.1 transcriptional regulator, MarR family [Methanobacterium paludis]
MDQTSLADLFSLTTEIRRKNALIMSLKLKKFDITHEQWFVLRTITNTDFSTQKVIADLTNKGKSTLTRILDQLEQKNLIERHVNDEDRRSIVLVETNKGKTIVQQILPVEEEIRTRIRNGISEDEIIHLNNMFKKFLDNIEEIIREET